MTTLAVRSLAVRYHGQATALDDVSLNVEDGQTVALLGASGSGKTTLARTILGLLPTNTAVQGQLWLSGVDVLALNARNRRALCGTAVGYIPQDALAACNPLRCVAHHVAEAWTAQGLSVSNASITDRLQALNVHRAERCAHEKPHQWSGGMLQRCAIAAAIAHNPPLVVADEPTSSLDRELAIAVVDQIKSVSRSQLIITHDIELACHVADEIVVLDRGRIVETANPRALLLAPRSLVARNMVEAFTASVEA